jgi:type I restriction enzyme M protein
MATPPRKPSSESSATHSPNGRTVTSFREIADFLWSIADLLRGTYKQADYGKVILPMTVLRRLDCVLEPTKAKVLEAYAKEKSGKVPRKLDRILNRVSKVRFHNVSKLDFDKLKGNPSNIAQNLNQYIKGFSADVRDIFIERFKFDGQIQTLDEKNLLFMVVSRFAEVDLHPEAVSNHTMGLVFEELIRRFSEQSNETAGEHFTLREVIRLMVDLLFIEDDDALRKPGIIRSLYDPACGTGGMLSVAEEHLRDMNPGADLKVFGQELNDESFAICRADMMIKGQDPENIVPGNSFSLDGHSEKKFDYLLSNPPFGVDWKNVQAVVENEHETQGFAGRFGPGLPRISDGSTLFLLHMLSKMKPPKEGGSRLAIVFNGSPLFSGDAGSGESEIRRWVIENDWLEAIVGLPDQLFYNTGISTYIWVVTNRKPKERKGKVQLINAADLFQKMKKSLGNKRNELAQANIDEIVRLYGEFKESDRSKIFDNDDFGYRRIVVERPLRLSFQASHERIERLKEESAFQRLATTKKKGKAGEEEIAEGTKLQAAIIAALGSLGADRVWKSRPEFEKALDAALAKVGKVAAPVRKAILSALGKRDETAEVCLGADGMPEPDAELRDNENVPRKEKIADYFEREVKPHVPNAWVDEAKTVDGYEVPFTRHFYKYAPLRPAGEVEADIRKLQGEIQGMLGDVIDRRNASAYSLAVEGLNRAAPLRDSGHEWIGNIPAHWDVARIRQVARLESGHTPSRQHPEYWRPDECTIPWVSLADVWQIREGGVDVIRETSEKISPLGIANSAARVLPAGTVIVSRTASVGFSAMIAEPMATTQDFVNWVCGPRLRPRYLLYVFRAMRDEFRRLTMGSTHQTIYMPDVARFVTPVPPLAEQDAIVEEVSRRLSSFEALAAAVTAQIDRLGEYRQALITAAITGRLD